MDLTALHVDDDGYVRAPPADCYRALADLSSWPQWWPRTLVRASGEDAAHLRIGTRSRRLRLQLAVHTHRVDRGFHLTVRGDLVGTAEFWLEPGWDGTVVHHLATLRSAGRRGPRAYRTYRAWVRHGLWGLKDHAQAARVGAT